MQMELIKIKIIAGLALSPKQERKHNIKNTQTAIQELTTIKGLPIPFKTIIWHLS